MLSGLVPASLAQSGKETSQANIIISTDLGTQTISRHIYGHFSEHLGHCIYGGYWVGENTD
ncbi:MAG: alpha-N-arabinofuranosidase, partial [Bacteroidales bacterium]